jgi:hypothetical protein
VIKALNDCGKDVEKIAVTAKFQRNYSTEIKSEYKLFFQITKTIS